MDGKVIAGLNQTLIGKAGEKFSIEDLEEEIFGFLGEGASDYDLKLVRHAVAHQEAPFSLVYVLDWTGTAEDLDAVFQSSVLRHEWAVYKGEVYNARKSYDEPLWRYAGEPRLVGRFDDEKQALGVYDAISPERDWSVEVGDRRNGFLVEIGSYSYSPDGSLYSSGLVDSKVCFGRDGRGFRAATA